MIRQKLFATFLLIFIGSSSFQAFAQDVSAEDIRIDGEGNIVVGNNIRIGITSQTAEQMVADRDERIAELEAIIANRRFILAGRWSNDQDNDGFSGRVSVTREIQGSFYFDLTSVFGSHTCRIQGRADFEQSNLAHFKGEEECSISFEIDQTDETISISRQSGTCSLYCGMQGRFEGTFYRNKDVFSTKVLLPTNALEFMELVGVEYSSFQGRMTKIFSDAVPDLDGLDAIITTGSAAGFGDSPAIIMQRPDGAIWAAYVDWKGDGKGYELKYWSNAAGWDRRLPDTIREWVAKSTAIDPEALKYVWPKGRFSQFSPLRTEENLRLYTADGRVWYDASLEGRPSWCPNAETPVEIAICNSPVLSGKDIRLNAAFGQLKTSLAPGNFSQVQNVVRRFLTERNKCGPDVPCIAEKYRSVVNHLEEIPR